jgi:hypothetical protein
MQVVADEVHGPGSPLGNGFVVPRGAYAIGPQLPDNPEVSLDETKPTSRRFDSAWTAVLVFDAQPDVPVRDLVQQAGALGIRLHANCSTWPPNAVGVGDEVTCGAGTAAGTNDDLSVGPLPDLVVSIGLVRIQGTCITVCRSFGTMTFRSVGTHASNPVTQTLRAPRVEVPLNGHVRRIPDPGEPMEWLRVERGSYPLVVAFANPRCYAGTGKEMLFAVDHDGERVTQGYARQLGQLVARRGQRRGAWDVDMSVLTNGVNTAILERYVARGDNDARQYLRLRECSPM